MLESDRCRLEGLFGGIRTGDRLPRAHLWAAYESSRVRADFRHNVQRNSLREGLVSKRSPAACREVFNRRGPPRVAT